MDQQAPASSPKNWLDVWMELKKLNLTLDQTDTRLDIDLEQLERCYGPIAVDILRRLGTKPRLVVAIAGAPGSGKSAIALTLASLLNVFTRPGLATSIGLDGWHFPNAYLINHWVLHQGESVRLRDIKGAPETFDVETFKRRLIQIRQTGQAKYPVYSRKLHDPVADAGQVTLAHRIIIVEGNYLLMDEDPWRQLLPQYDMRIFVDTQEFAFTQALAERHLRGGKTPVEVEKQLMKVDLPDAARVYAHRARADLVIHKATIRRIERLEWFKA